MKDGKFEKRTDCIFGEHSISADALFEGISQSIRESGIPNLRHQDLLTTGLRNGLSRLAAQRNLRFETGPSGQFLVDHAWRRGELGLVLVAESEWRRDDQSRRRPSKALLLPRLRRPNWTSSTAALKQRLCIPAIHVRLLIDCAGH